MTVDEVDSSSEWSREQDKAFENALATHPEDDSDRWEKIAADVPGKTIEEIKQHYELLVEDINQIESGCVPLPSYNSSSEGSTSHASDEGAGKKGSGPGHYSGKKRLHRIRLCFFRGVEIIGSGSRRSLLYPAMVPCETELSLSLEPCCWQSNYMYCFVPLASRKSCESFALLFIEAFLSDPVSVRLSMEFTYCAVSVTRCFLLKLRALLFIEAFLSDPVSVRLSMEFTYCAQLMLYLISSVMSYNLRINDCICVDFTVLWLFLLGLDKYGKGDWRSISRNFVVTRTPTQVASHAQKYFIRLNSMNKDRRRSSIHDITSVNNGDISAPQGPITGQTNGSAGNSTAKAAKAATPASTGVPGVGIYAAPTIGQPIGGPLVSAVGTTVNLPAPAHMAYGVRAPVPGAVVPGAPVNMGPVTYPMQHTSVPHR
ncbi:Transcription factor SRM1 [Glycine soja]|uniref:Transcription factor SRM1 n=2 Tax=Glycine soja TaxID=3848 RepID=A0A445EZE1_GLYSO|nr:Transcription factor SRM1 [Glycine soja]